jgi:adenosylmethionine-8-amino-7-oxononanoate aminotransferase
VADLCRKYDLLLHVDEVITGFGRTGKMFGHEHWGVTPDIVTIAKGISSAYLPIAATVIKDHVFRSFYGDPAANRQVQQVNTYGGHPAAAAVALRNIEILLEERLTERAAEMGRYLLDGLGTLRRHPWVGDVRGKGLLAGVELVKDRQSKEPISAPHMQAMADSCRESGVIVGRSGGGRRYSNTVTMAPPLVITRSEIDRIVDVLDRVIGRLGGQLAGSA